MIYNPNWREHMSKNIHAAMCCPFSIFFSLSPPLGLFALDVQISMTMSEKKKHDNMREKMKN